MQNSTTCPKCKGKGRRRKMLMISVPDTVDIANMRLAVPAWHVEVQIAMKRCEECQGVCMVRTK